MSKTILITGSSKGIGFELAKQCARIGYRVIISGRNETELIEALKILKQEFTNVYSIVIDVSNQNSLESATTRFKEDNIKLDVLVNNAAIISKYDKSLIEIEASIFNETISTNAFAPLWVTRAFAPILKSPGKVIMMSSAAGMLTEQAYEWAPSYCMSKTVLNIITRQLAHELKSKNIAVNAVCPGWVKTNMGGPNALSSLEKGVETPLWLVEELHSGYTGKFFIDKKVTDW